MGAPNPDDPLANDVADHWKRDEPGAIATGTSVVSFCPPNLSACVTNPSFLVAAEEWTKTYAMQ